MQRYSYYIGLRIWHPSIKPEEITNEIGLQPSHFSEAGQPRKTPKGTPLEGVYRESYWSTDPFSRGEYSSTDDLAEDAISEVLQLLIHKKDFLLKLRGEGARVILQVSSFSNRNYAIELPPDILFLLSDLGISFAHDIYAYA